VTEEAVLSESDSGLDEDLASLGCGYNAHGIQVYVWLRPQHPWSSHDVHPFTLGPSGLRIQEVPRVNKDSMPITTFLLFFMELIQLLVAETNKSYNQYLDTLDNDRRCS
jgi:hypothetical protein